jgi:von Willebrand factor type A domain-containing protein
MRRASLAIVLVWFGCGPVHTSGGSGGSGGSGTAGAGGMYSGGAGGSPGSGGAGGTGGSGGGIDNTPDALNCGVENFALQPGLPPDLMIVLDRSGSMSDPPGSGGASKWMQVTGALNATVMQLQSQIKFGLEYFPTDSDCAVASPDVPVGPNSGAAIAASIATHMPDGLTPTADAIHNAAVSLMSVGDQNPKYILLATDGDPTCDATYETSTSDDAMDAGRAVSEAATAGVHTFVVGVATDTTSEATLNDLAMRGMEPRPNGPPYYYLVTNQQDLVTTINMIAGQIISCSFMLQMVPPYPDEVTITANGQTVPRDPTHMNGWDYGPGMNSIQFYGSYCQSLQNGMVMNVMAVFGCPPIGRPT